MRKVFLAVVVLISLVFILLPAATPLQGSTYSLLDTASDDVRPVSFHYHRSNSDFINGLAGFTYAAHRGAPIVSNEPENSLPAFEAAKKSGFRIVETDLQLTKDGQWLIMHDYTLDRTSTGQGPIRSHSLRDIEKLKLKNDKNETVSIPTLDEFLKLCKNEGLMPILDIKPNERQISDEDYNSLLTSLNYYNLLDKSIFCSYSKEVLSELRRRDDVTTIAVMMDATEENLNFTKQLSNAFIYCDYNKLTDDKINLIKDNNLKFGVWTVDDEEKAQYFLKRDALIVVTDKLLGKI